MYSIVSRIANPADTDPPGELIYRSIGFSGLSASRKRSCAVMMAETSSVTGPFRHMIRSCTQLGIWSSQEAFDLALSSREKISCVCQPPCVTSVTNGMKLVGARLVKFLCPYWKCLGIRKARRLTDRRDIAREQYSNAERTSRIFNVLTWF